jgi:hypothetical protein
VSTGKLYKASDGQFLTDVNYHFQHESPKQWWGELTLVDFLRLGDGGGYILELEDKRKSKCALKKRVNMAVMSLPPRYAYRFSGTDEFK